jgi:glutamine phosphoribosylpyrophosphate amidotransferase
VSYTDLELDKLHEECGVFGIYSHKEDVPLNIYWGLYALQHRGQESCGIAVSDGKEMQIKLGMGLVPDVFKDGVSAIWQDMWGSAMCVIPPQAPAWFIMCSR